MRPIIGLEIKIAIGIDIKDAFKAALEIAKMLRCNVEFSFNGIKCSISPNGSVWIGVNQYRLAMRSESINYAHAG